MKLSDLKPDDIKLVRTPEKSSGLKLSDLNSNDISSPVEDELYSKARSLSTGIFGGIPFSKQIGAAGKTAADFISGNTPVADIPDEYHNQLDILNSAFDKAQKANPKTALLGNLAGGVALTGGLNSLATGAVKQGALYGGASGLSNSNARGENLSDTLEHTAEGTLTGAAIGNVAEAVIPSLVSGTKSLYKGGKSLIDSAAEGLKGADQAPLEFQNTPSEADAPLLTDGHNKIKDLFAENDAANEAPSSPEASAPQDASPLEAAKTTASDLVSDIDEVVNEPAPSTHEALSAEISETLADPKLADIHGKIEDIQARLENPEANPDVKNILDDTSIDTTQQKLQDIQNEKLKAQNDIEQTSTDNPSKLDAEKLQLNRKLEKVVSDQADLQAQKAKAEANGDEAALNKIQAKEKVLEVKRFEAARALQENSAEYETVTDAAKQSGRQKLEDLSTKEATLQEKLEALQKQKQDALKSVNEELLGKQQSFQQQFEEVKSTNAKKAASLQDKIRTSEDAPNFSENRESKLPDEQGSQVNQSLSELNDTLSKVSTPEEAYQAVKDFKDSLPEGVASLDNLKQQIEEHLSDQSKWGDLAKPALNPTQMAGVKGRVLGASATANAAEDPGISALNEIAKKKSLLALKPNLKALQNLGPKGQDALGQWLVDNGMATAHSAESKLGLIQDALNTSGKSIRTTLQSLDEQGAQSFNASDLLQYVQNNYAKLYSDIPGYKYVVEAIKQAAEKDGNLNFEQSFDLKKLLTDKAYTLKGDPTQLGNVQLLRKVANDATNLYKDAAITHLSPSEANQFLRDNYNFSMASTAEGIAEKAQAKEFNEGGLLSHIDFVHPLKTFDSKLAGIGAYASNAASKIGGVLKNAASTVGSDVDNALSGTLPYDFQAPQTPPLNQASPSLARGLQPDIGTGTISHFVNYNSQQLVDLADKVANKDDSNAHLSGALREAASAAPQRRNALLFTMQQNPSYREALNKATER